MIWRLEYYTGASFLSPPLLSGADCFFPFAGTDKLGGDGFFGGIVDVIGSGGGFGFSAAGIADWGGGGGCFTLGGGAVSV